MEDEERRKHPHDLPVEEIRSQASPFIMKRQEVTADFDERQKQCFNEALIAILVAGLPPEKIEQVLVAARDTAIYITSGEILADTRLANTQAVPATTMLLSCTKCRGYSLRLRSKLVQCNDCGTIQPVIIDRPRVVENGRVVQELAARYFPTGDTAKAALREEEESASLHERAMRMESLLGDLKKNATKITSDDRISLPSGEMAMEMPVPDLQLIVEIVRLLKVLKHHLTLTRKLMP